MSGHDSKYFSTTKKGEIPELKEELNSQYKVPPSYLSLSTVFASVRESMWYFLAQFTHFLDLLRLLYWLR